MEPARALEQERVPAAAVELEQGRVQAVVAEPGLALEMSHVHPEFVT